MSATAPVGKSTWRWLLGTAGKGLWEVVPLCALQALMAANGVAFALVMREAIDGAVAGDASAFESSCAVFAALVLAQLAMRAANRSLGEHALSTVENALRGKVLASVVEGDYRKASSRHSGEVMTRLTSDVSAAASGLVTMPPSVLSMGVRVVGALGAMFVLVPGLATAFVAVGCVLALCSVGLRGPMKQLHRRVQESEGRMRCFAQECVESLLVVRAFACEEKVELAHEENMRAHRSARMRRANASALCNAGLGLAMQGAYVLAFVWCGWGLLEGTVSYGTLMAAVQLVGQVQSPFASIGSQFSKLSAMTASAERLMELTEDGGGRRPQTKVRSMPTPPRVARISVRGASFSYGGEAVLDRLDAEIGGGEFVAVAGRSGAGKSTLMKLMLGAYEPDSGAVAVAFDDGSELSACDAPAGTFAYVPQGNFLMSGTVREVVGFSERGDRVDDAKALRACWAACADGFVGQLPDGLDTVLGERGAGISEGQAQRLAVARAVYSGAPVLLLDEATSALDAATERTLVERLRGLGRTVIIVTHRAEVRDSCDRVIWIGRD